MRRSTWHLRVGAVVAAWLVAALASVVAGLVVPVPDRLPVHLLLLGAVSNAVLIWSRHFTDALLRLPADDRRLGEAARLVVFNAGAAAVVLGLAVDRLPLVVAGAGAVALVAALHAGVMLGQLRAGLPARFGMTVHYYVAAAGLLVVGALLGVLLAQDTLGAQAHARVAVAHVVVNLLGWVGLTIAGTLLTLWPTMLRTRLVEGAERAATRALPVLVTGVVLAAGGALAGSRPAAAAGLLLYVAGLVLAARPLAAEARNRPPTTYATRSVLAGVLWFAGCVTALGGLVLAGPDWHDALGAAHRLGVPLLAGFAAQVLLGALSYLVPVVLGGGPRVVRATTAVMETGGTVRIAAVNLGLVVHVLPMPAVLATLGDLLLLAGLAAFLPLLGRAVLVERALTREAVPVG